MSLVSAVCLTIFPKRTQMLSDALLSFQLQTHADKELVIVNDGAPLRSVHPQCRVVNLPRGLTIGKLREAGAVAARGKWLATWDDDDFSLPFRMTQQLLESGNGRSKYVHPRSHWLADSRLRVIGAAVNGCYEGAMMDRDAVLSLGYPNTTRFEDFKMYVKLVTMAHVNAEHWAGPSFYVHRRHGANTTIGTHGGEAGAMSDYPGAVPVGSEELARINATLLHLLATPRVRYIAPG